MSKVQASLLEIWEDLRARRLVPVAVLLLAGIVAVPLLLSKKSEEPVVPPPPAAESSADQSQGPEELAKVKLDEFKTGSGSSLSAFDASNPFAPPAKVIQAARDEAQGDTGALAPGGQVVPGDGGTGGTGTGDTGTGDTGTGDTGGDTPDDGTGEGGDTKTTQFTYVIDVTLWSNGRRRKIEGLEKLDMLPSAASPLLIFMGVTDGAGNTVFLVDSTLQTTGEGKCKPSRAECGVLYLGPGSEQEFTNEDGDSYRLRIDQIRKVKVGDAGKTASTSSKEETKSAKAALGRGIEVRRFVPPVLTDLVVESSNGRDASTRSDTGR